MAAVTIFALVSYFFMPKDAWLPANRISRFVDSKGVVSETVEEVGSGAQRKDREDSGNVSATNDTPVSN
jgi:hypothetical protein